MIFNNPIYSNAATLDSVISSGDSFLNINNGENATPVITPDESKLQAISNTVSNILLTIALGVTLISAVIMGINFTIQSVEDKAKIKESMVPWIIGIIISFGAYGIWQITMGVFYDLII
jgi:H+/Cl- antiporter ClcA